MHMPPISSSTSLAPPSLRLPTPPVLWRGRCVVYLAAAGAGLTLLFLSFVCFFRASPKIESDLRQEVEVNYLTHSSLVFDAFAKAFLTPHKIFTRKDLISILPLHKPLGTFANQHLMLTNIETTFEADRAGSLRQLPGNFGNVLDCRAFLPRLQAQYAALIKYVGHEESTEELVRKKDSLRMFQPGDCEKEARAFTDFLKTYQVGLTEQIQRWIGTQAGEAWFQDHRLPKPVKEDLDKLNIGQKPTLDLEILFRLASFYFHVLQPKEQTP
jgi:hypothetical protein